MDVTANMINTFPPVEALLDLEPEELGEYLLIYLNHVINESGPNKAHRQNVISSTNRELRQYAENNSATVNRIMYRLSEAWSWLEREGFLSPLPDEPTAGWVFITRRGEKIKSREDFGQFKHLSLLPRKILDPALSQKVWSPFIRGSFDTAIFEAFKEVEIRLRKALNLSSTDFVPPVELARRAFNVDNGILTDKGSDKGERQAYSDLFAGALGAFKNPTSHRDINYSDPVTAASLILHANTLLQIIEGRTPKT